MNIKLISLICVLALSGCGKDRIVYKDRFVEIPKIVFKEMPLAPKIKFPEYYIMKIDKNSTDDEVLNAVIITLIQQDKHIHKQEIALKPYQEQDDGRNRIETDK